MAAYLIANVDVHDRDGYVTDYAPLARASVARHGGRFLVRGGRSEVVEGDDFRGRVVIIEFHSYEAALDWYHSDDYQAAAAVRRRYSTGSQVIVEGTLS